MSLQITIQDKVKELIPGFSLGVIEYKECVISDTPKMIKGKINLFLADLRLTYGSDGLSNIPGIKEWRKAFKKVGIDPSKYRPSSEALLKRTLQEKPMYWINSAVDLNNFFSMKFALPYGIYNKEQIRGNVLLRLGEPNESYMGLNGRETSMEGKLVLCDDLSPFGSPIVDSVRTSIAENAGTLLQFVFVHPEFPRDQIQQLLKESASFFTHVNGGEVEDLRVI